MAITQALPNSFKKQLLDGDQDLQHQRELEIDLN